MKTFIKKVIIFLAMPALYMLSMMLCNFFILNKQKLPMKRSAILIAGDSHPQTSINPALLTSAQNISQLAEPYVLTYWKLKTIFDTHAPDSLMLGFAHHNFSAFNDYKFSDKKWSAEMMKRSYLIQAFDEVDADMPVDYSLYYKTIWKQFAFYPNLNMVHYIGAFRAQNSGKVDDWKSVIDRHFYKDTVALPVSNMQVQYFDSIMVLCKTKNIPVFLIASPVHFNYYQAIPADFKREFDQIKSRYAKAATVLDFTNLQYPDSLFSNSDHLNKKGADRFTVEVRDSIYRIDKP